MDSDGAFLEHSSSFVDLRAAEQTGEEEEVCFGSLFATMRTYQMEFDPGSPSGRLPRCFARELGDVVASYVILQDPNYNEFEVHVTKKSGELYFDDGWLALKDVYNLLFGAWVTFTYVNPEFLIMRLTTRWGAEVVYPTYHPPLRHLLPRAAPNHTFGMSCVDRPVSQRTYARSYFKQITLDDIYSGVLFLPWEGFGEYFFDFTFSDCVLIDELAKRYPCKLKFGVDYDDQLACKITDGWIDFCMIRGVFEGHKIRVSIMEPVHNYEIYISIYSPRRLY